jgi:hypothetical protein
MDVRMGRFEGRNMALGYLGPRRPSPRLKKCFRGLRKAMVDAGGRSSRPIAAGARRGEYRPHRPHRHEGSDLQGFLAVGTLACNRPQTVGYRPLPQSPSAKRPRRNVAFCRRLCCMAEAAVGAVGILTSFTDGLDRSQCMFLPERYRCIWRATTFTPTRTPAILCFVRVEADPVRQWNGR